MEKTPRLDLYKLDNGDYANHWEIPCNANMQSIEDEAVSLATELLTTPTDEYGGQLAGSAGSLQARLNVAMTTAGDIKFNSNDLDKSCHQMDGFETTAIHTRLANVDRREFVNARLRYLQQNVASGEFLNKVDGYDPGVVLSDEEASRYADNFAQRYGSQLFCFIGDCVDPVVNAGDLLEINPMGWCSIAGRLFYHKNISYYQFVGTGRWSLYLTQEPLVGGSVHIDNRLIRSYASTSGPCAPGDTTANGSTFTAPNIGIASSAVGNNDWRPEPFQILRIEIAAGVYEEYLIKGVLGANSIEIYGEFPHNPALVGVHWWVLDYTIPCVNLYAYVHSAAAIKALMSNRYFYGDVLLYAYGISYNFAAHRFYATKMHHAANLYQTDPGKVFYDMTNVALTSAVPGDAYYQVDIGGAGSISPFNVSKMTILCLERSVTAGDTAEFAFSIDPVAYTSGSHDIPVLHAEIVRTLSKLAAPGGIETWFDEPGEKSVPGGPRQQFTYLRVYTDDHAETKKWCFGSGAVPGAGLTRVWWGVLIEYA